MGAGELMTKPWMPVTLLAVVAVLAPFAAEQIGEATSLYSFPAWKTVNGWFRPAPPPVPYVTQSKVDWGRCREMLETFSEWADLCEPVTLEAPRAAPAVLEVPEEESPVRALWHVAVTGCAPAAHYGDRRGHVFISGFTRQVDEGGIIEPTETACGYEILAVNERSVWLRALIDPEKDRARETLKLPAFTSVEGDRLTRGSRYYKAGDAFALTGGCWLLLDGFLGADTAIFRMLNGKRETLATLLFVALGSKRGK